MMKTVFKLSLALLSAAIASAEVPGFGAKSVFGIRGGGLFGGKDKGAAAVAEK